MPPTATLGMAKSPRQDQNCGTIDRDSVMFPVYVATSSAVLPLAPVQAPGIPVEAQKETHA